MCVSQAYQHVYLAALYGLLKVKSVLVDDFAAWARGSIGQLRLSRMTPGEAAMFWSCKVLYVAYYIALPAVCSHHSWAALAALWLIAELIAGWMLAFLFQARSLSNIYNLPASLAPEKIGCCVAWGCTVLFAR